VRTGFLVPREVAAAAVGGMWARGGMRRRGGLAYDPAMDLRDAYRELDVAIGADEAAVRDAKKVLAKVWHPDRHATDPTVLARAQTKLRTVNEAFEVIRAAGFPKTVASAGPAPVAVAPPVVRVEAPRVAPPDPGRGSHGGIEIVGRRRMRLWVVALFTAAIGVGAYLAIVRLGARAGTPPPVIIDAGAVATRSDDAAPSDPPIAIAGAADAGAPSDPPIGSDAADEPALGSADAGDDSPTDRDAAPPMAATAGTFTLGSTKAQVRAVMGAPKSIDQVIHETWRWDFSSVDFDGDRVIGWWQIQTPLKVSLPPRDAAVAAAARTRGTLHAGSTKDEVLGVLGTPTHVYEVINETWAWSYSYLEFDAHGRVVDAFLADTPLHYTK
jgi:hypothetical protein